MVLLRVGVLVSAYPLGAKLPEDAEVSVYEPCACATCAAGARWFMCPRIHDRAVARYGCTSVVEAVDEGEVFTREGVPDPRVVEQIRALHPGKVFVYLDA